MKRTLWRTRTIVVLALVAALTPAILLADHQYNDVPVQNPFHADIDAITRAGITAGCGGANPQGFCPDQPITRQAEAAFLHRGLSRVAMSTDSLASEIGFSSSFEDDTLIAEVDLEVGGTTAKDPAAHQFVKVEATLEANWQAGDAPFPVALYLVDETNQISQHVSFTVQNDVASQLPVLVSFSWVFPEPPGEHTFELWGYGFGNEPDVTHINSSTLVATTHTFGEVPVAPLSAPGQRRGARP